MALRLGAENEAFGVINVGNDAKLVKLCGENGLATGECQFSGSLFHQINQPQSKVHLLIGSKKFTEGWNSWRVSTMGLMNVGKSEGAQIIQLFGRGVRLKGYDLSLKRSDKNAPPRRRRADRSTSVHPRDTWNLWRPRQTTWRIFGTFSTKKVSPATKTASSFYYP